MFLDRDSVCIIKHHKPNSIHLLCMEMSTDIFKSHKTTKTSCMLSAAVNKLALILSLVFNNICSHEELLSMPNVVSFCQFNFSFVTNIFNVSTQSCSPPILQFLYSSLGIQTNVLLVTKPASKTLRVLLPHKCVPDPHSSQESCQVMLKKNTLPSLSNYC